MTPPNVAVIFAGGTGQRMNSRTRPKQFLELHGKPILIYTLEHFQRHEQIDGIILVCLEDWQRYCCELIEQYHLTKIKAVVPGGATGLISIYQGIVKASDLYPDETVCLIHDGVRPLIDGAVITKNIESVLKYGPSVTVVSTAETFLISDRKKIMGESIDRERSFIARAPLSCRLRDILGAYEKMPQLDKSKYWDSTSLLCASGYKLYMVEGPSENIKITTPSDFYIFRAIMDAKENSQILGL